MKIGTYETGRCYFEDCIAALSEFPSNSIDLCLTDLPYGIGIGGSYPRAVSRRKGLNHEIYYEDPIDSTAYHKFMVNWFREITRVCKHVIFTPGENNLSRWYDLETPVGVLYHYKKNGNSPGSISRLICTDPILVYGKWDRMQYFRKNAYDIPLKTKTSDPFLARLIHPCPKSYELWEAILYDYMHPVYGDLTIPNVILDPFIGSGTTAELCEANGLDWIGFETKADYKHDVDLRIERGRERRASAARKVMF